MKFKRKNVGFKDFIFLQPKQLTPQFCEQVIELYENHPTAQKYRQPGLTLGARAGDAKNHKWSEDINISNIPDFAVEDKILSIALEKLTKNYLDHVRSFNEGFEPQYSLDYQDSGFQIQKTTPGGYYDWHHDQIDDRRYTYIFYLNDVNHEGETQFANGLKIKPEKGKGLMFPASWEYVHRGIAPKDEIKYIATGWISAIKIQSPLENELEFN